MAFLLIVRSLFYSNFFLSFFFFFFFSWLFNTQHMKACFSFITMPYYWNMLSFIVVCVFFYVCAFNLASCLGYSFDWFQKSRLSFENRLILLSTFKITKKYNKTLTLLTLLRRSVEQKRATNNVFIRPWTTHDINIQLLTPQNSYKMMNWNRLISVLFS